jgi:hypothetical protein
MYDDPIPQLKQHDLDTGEETLESREFNLKLADDQIVLEGQAIEAMVGTEGWRLVSDFIEEAIQAHTQSLIMQKDLDEIRRLQETIQAYATIQSFVIEKISAGRRQQEQNHGPAKG